MTRVSSFTQAASLVKHTGLAAVLPENAAVEFDQSLIASASLPWSNHRQMVLIANARSLDRAGLRTDASPSLAGIMAWKSDRS
jgi:hypothetical protein